MASRKSANAITASSANRTRVLLPLRRGFTSFSNHSSSTWCRKMFDRQGEITPALRGAFGRMAQETIFQDPCLQPFIDHPSDDTIRDSSVKKVAQVGVRNRIEVFFDVEIDHPTQSVAHEASTQIL